MLSAVVSILFIAAVVGAAYWWVLRPVLRTRPDLQAHYAAIDGFWAWLNERTRGWRTIILARLVQLGWAALALHDAVIPYLVGVDWTPLTARVLAFIPPDLRALALSLFGVLCAAVVEWFRRITTGPVPGSGGADR